jgi:hypothetical protein
LLNLAGLKVPEKQVERVTERIGQERLDQRDAQTQAFLKLPVTEKFAAAVAHPPDLAVVEMDGGRLQIRDDPAQETAPTASADLVDARGVAPAVEDQASAPMTAGEADSQPTAAQTRHGHWREDKIGLLMTMTSEESAADPCPEIPETFVNPLRIIKLARELKKGGAVGEDAVVDPTDSAEESPLESPEYTPPAVRVKSMVATRQGAEFFGTILAAAALARGFYGAKRKAFLGDGAETNWTVQRRWFSDFVAILDFIHALSYVFAAAMAGRKFAAGWEVYVRWIRWAWQGQVVEVIKELEQRQAELGMPADDEPETSPKQVVADTLRYLRNNQQRMRYDEYRRLGLPITSSHVESTVKQFNRRVKGTEKFWSEKGAEALLQLRADYLSETEPMEKFWKDREANSTGRRQYRRAI